MLAEARSDAWAVAAHLGFTDAANFGRYSWEYTGLIPVAFAASPSSGPPARSAARHLIYTIDALTFDDKREVRGPEKRSLA
ncbi:hypothetical protein ACWEVP_03735 [Amycolatopsis sp. NPDC003865]